MKEIFLPRFRRLWHYILLVTCVAGYVNAQTVELHDFLVSSEAMVPRVITEAPRRETVPAPLFRAPSTLNTLPPVAPPGLPSELPAPLPKFNQPSQLPPLQPPRPVRGAPSKPPAPKQQTPMPINPLPPTITPTPLPSDIPPPPMRPPEIGNAPVSTPTPQPSPSDVHSSEAELFELVNQALVSNPVVVASRARVNESLGLQLQAGLYPNPSISMIHQEMGNNGSSGQHGVAWNKPLVRSRRIEDRAAVATSNVSIAELDLQVTEQRLANQVRRAYYLVRLAQMRRDAFEQLSKSSNEITGAVKQLVEVGELAKTSLYQAELAGENVLAQFMAAETSLPAIRQSLAALVNTEPHQLKGLKSLQGAVKDAVPDYQWEKAVERMRGENLQLCIQQMKIHRAGSNVALQRSLQNPDWRLQFSVYYDDDTDDSFGGVSVTRPVQLRDWNQGNVRAAHARQSGASNAYGALELAARSALGEAFQNYLSAQQRMARFREKIIPRAEQSLKLVSDALSAGEATYLETLTSQQQYINAFSTYLDLLKRCIESSIEVENVITGVSGPKA